MRRYSDLASFQHVERKSLFASAKERFLQLAPGDRVIAGALLALLGFLLLAGLYAIERQFLVEVPSRGGSLTEGVSGHPRFINPLLALSDADRDMTVLTYAGLMGYGKDGGLVPVLAESYEVSEDGKTYTFVLRDNIRFSDGTPVTAEDVVFTVQKAQDPGLLSPRLADWANIAVRTQDARTVVFTLPQAYAPFLEDATLGILPAHIWRNVSNEQFPFSPYMEKPVGAGPFTATAVRRDKDGVIERYELAAFDQYALGRPYLSRLSFVFFDTDEELAKAYGRGSVESAQGVASADALSAPYSRVFGVFWNASKNPAFARIEVRRALSVALDRDALVDDVLGGYGAAAEGPVPPGLLGSTEHDHDHGDPIAEAADILESYDWTYDVETRAWVHEDAGTLSVTLSTSNVPELRAIADHVREDWERLGIETTIEFHEPSELVASVIRPRNYDALLFGMVVGRDQDLFAFWHSSQRNDPGLNVSLYANREVDDLLEKIRTEQDPAQLASDLEELNGLVAADYPAAFTHAPTFLYAIPEDLHGVALGSVAEPSDRFLSIAFWYRHTQAVWPIFAGD